MHTIQFVREHFGMTILLIEHDMKLVAGICEQVTVLNFGSELAHGTPSEVLQNREVITAYPVSYTHLILRSAAWADTWKFPC